MVDLDQITAYRQRQKEIFSNELEQYGSYEKWYEKLKPFRELIINKYLAIYSTGTQKNGMFLHKDSIILENGNFLDHHLGGYVSPLEVTNIGLTPPGGGCDNWITASRQIIQLDEQFKQHGIRFIYIPLPCKLAVYPEYIFPFETYDIPRNVIPQWRKMLHEILDAGVEMIDMYPIFMKHKSTPLYVVNDHFISYYGAEVIAKSLAEYLLNTMPDTISKADRINLRTEIEKRYVSKRDGGEFDVFKDEMKRIIDSEGYPYLGFGRNSEIGIFGNCNLQAFMYHGSGITANLAYHLGIDVDYLGRYMPFLDGCYSISNIPAGSFKNKKVVIYVGFPSGAFVRSRVIEDKEKYLNNVSCLETEIRPWCTKYILEEAFL